LESFLVIILAGVDIGYRMVPTDQVYLAAIVIVCAIFYLYIAFDGVYKSNIFEIWAVILAILFVLAFVIFRFVEAVPRQALQWATLFVVVVLDIGFVIIVSLVFKHFEMWKFRKLSQTLRDSKELRAKYKIYEAFIALLKLDVQFGVILILEGFFFFFSSLETIVEMAAILITFGWAFLGNMAIRIESKKLMCVFFLFSVAEPINIIYKLIDIYRDDRSNLNFPLYQIFFTAVVALIIRTVLIINVIVLVKNFGKGLRSEVFDPQANEEPILNKAMGVKSLRRKESDEMVDFPVAGKQDKQEQPKEVDLPKEEIYHKEPDLPKEADLPKEEIYHNDDQHLEEGHRKEERRSDRSDSDIVSSEE